jgi:hypothetical protein
LYAHAKLSRRVDIFGAELIRGWNIRYLRHTCTMGKSIIGAKHRRAA